MIYLLLSVLSTTLIFIFFKLAGKLKLNTLLIIVINYLVAGLSGILFSGSEEIVQSTRAEWFLPTVLLGSGFVGMFYLLAYTTQKAGAAPAVVANKMSVIIPIVVAFLLYGDSITILKVAGICLALAGIFFVTWTASSEGQGRRMAWLLLLLFVGSGAIDTLIKLIEITWLSEKDTMAFTTVLFLTAFTSGSMVLTFRMRKHLDSLRLRVLLVAIGLGLVNFGSIYFLVRALQIDGMQSSVLFPLNNIGVVIASSALSAWLFSEKLDRRKVGGIFVCVLALALLMLAR